MGSHPSLLSSIIFKVIFLLSLLSPYFSAVLAHYSLFCYPHLDPFYKILVPHIKFKIFIYNINQYFDILMTDFELFDVQIYCCVSFWVFFSRSHGTIWLTLYLCCVSKDFDSDSSVNNQWPGFWNVTKRNSLHL